MQSEVCYWVNVTLSSNQVNKGTVWSNDVRNVLPFVMKLVTIPIVHLRLVVRHATGTVCPIMMLVE